MHLNNDKNFKENIFLAFIFLYFFLISIFQASDNHWSAIIDQDIFLIYNSLLIYSGFEQEYIDHPAFSTFFILGGIYKILSKKNISMVYYKWNGIKNKDGPIYEFYRMEYIKTDRKTGLVKSLEGLWSQTQFLDQLK